MERVQQITEWAAKHYPTARKWVIKAFPHTVIVIAGMMIVFFCIDRVNKPMAFMTNEFHKWLSLILALCGIGYSIDYIARQRKSERAAEARRIKALQAKRAGRAQQRPSGAPERAAKAPAANASSQRKPAERKTASTPARRA